jgi:hypothetical protein
MYVTVRIGACTFRAAAILTPRTHNPVLRQDSFGPREMGIARSLKAAQLANEYPLHER